MEALVQSDERTKYTIVLTTCYGSDTTQFQIETWFTELEAARAYKYLSQRIAYLTAIEGGYAPIPISMVCRNEENQIITYGISGVYAINHNIPALEIVEE